jgi:ATP-dependent DNA helicase PIF1
MDNLDIAYSQLKRLDVHTFLTGDAGTGKSTLIRKFIAEHPGQCIVCAPTGIAAVNIGGVTMHRFFHFPARPISKDTVKWLNPAEPNDNTKIQVIKAARYLIIDEISMVRADLMDQIDWFFQKNRTHFPSGFGGLKLIMVGDLDQLSPVVASEEEKIMMNSRYTSEFFFAARCWEREKFETVKLTKVWRQTDPVFIKLLNDIKNNTLAPFDLDNLNNKCLNDGLLKPEMGVMLCSTNEIAAEVNAEMIYRIPGQPIFLEGTISGEFNEKNCPVDKTIMLKPWCRVMIMRNSPNGEYYNGSIGVFTGLNDYEDAINIMLDNGDEISLPQYIFETIEYKYDDIKDKITHTVTGEFTQYPIKAAYAITVHKSQGQTFDKVIIDLGDHGAFAHGQTYVALSRCRSMEGITLRRKIRQRDLIYSKSILKFKSVQ